MTHTPPIGERLYEEYLEHLLGGDVCRCRLLVQGLFEQGVRLTSIYEDLLTRAMYQVGEMWAAGDISTAMEHLATAQTEDVMRMTYLLTLKESADSRSKAIVSCVAREMHYLGARMVADVLELQGWEVAYLGANTPQDSLLDLTEHLEADVLALSVTMPDNLARLHETVADARRRMPNLRVLVGGQAFCLAGQAGEPEVSGATYVKSVSQIEGVLS